MCSFVGDLLLRYLFIQSFAKLIQRYYIVEQICLFSDIGSKVREEPAISALANLAVRLVECCKRIA